MGGADADRDDRLAEGDDHDQAVALGEVAGDQFPAFGAEEVGPGHVEEEGKRPERALGEAVEQRRRGQQRDGDGGAGGQPEDRVAQRVVLGAGEHEEGDLGAAHDPVDQREGKGQVAEGFRHAERDQQQRRHRAEDDQAHRTLLGVDHAGQPGVAGPGPPEHAEHQQALGQARPGRVVRHQRRALGYRQHEDEVEEELQRRYPLAFAQGRAEAGGAGFVGGGHRRHPSQAALGRLGVFGVVLGEQPLLLVALGEGEEDERGAEQDRDDAGL